MSAEHSVCSAVHTALQQQLRYLQELHFIYYNPQNHSHFACKCYIFLYALKY